MFGELPVELYFDPTQVIRPGRRGVFRWTLKSTATTAVITELELELESASPGFSAAKMNIAPRHIERGGHVSCTQDLLIDSNDTTGYGVNIHVRGKLDGKRRFDLVSVNQHILKFLAKGDGSVISMQSGAAGVFVPEALAHDRVHLRGTGGIAHFEGLNPETDYVLEGYDGAVLGTGADLPRAPGNLKTGDQVCFEKMEKLALMHRPQGIHPLDFETFSGAWRHRTDLLIVDFVDSESCPITSATMEDNYIVRVRTKKFGYLLLFGQDASGNFTQWVPNTIGFMDGVRAGDHLLPGALLPLPSEALGLDNTRIYFNATGVERVMGFLLETAPFATCISAQDPSKPISEDLMGEILVELCARTDASLAQASVVVRPESPFGS